MQKKYLKKRKLSKSEREWLAEFIREEVRHGSSEKQAKQDGLEVIHRSDVDITIKK